MKVKLLIVVLFLLLLLITSFTYSSSQEIVYLEDPNLKEIIRKELNIRYLTITQEDLDKLIRLDANMLGIRSIKGIELCKNLQELNLYSNYIKDIEPLKSLTKLKKLGLGGNSIIDISSIRNLKNLEYLNVQENMYWEKIKAENGETIWKDFWLTDINPVSSLQELKRLNIDGNRIKSIKSVKNLPQLEELIITNNKMPIHYHTNGNREIIEELVINDVKVMWREGNDVASTKNVVFVDNELEFAVRKEIGIHWRNKVTYDLLEKLVSLEVKGKGIKNLKGIENAIHLEKLALWNNEIRDVSSLSGLKNLKELYLDKNNITDISPLKNLSNLTHLWLNANNLSEVDTLSNFNKLIELKLWRNNIKDINSISNLTHLKHIDLGSNLISNTSPITNLANNIKTAKTPGGIVYLDLSDNLINTIQLSNLKDVKELYLQRNRISNIDDLSGLVNLNRLDISDNNISDAKPLANLKQLSHLWLSYNDFDTLDSLRECFKLQVLYSDYNDIKDITVLSALYKGGAFQSQKYNEFINIQHNDIDIENGSDNRKTIDELISNGVNIEWELGNNLD